MAGALDGVQVIDCSQGVAGPMAAMYMADFGADVVKVEPPTGEPGRTSPGFPLWNRNKRGITIALDDLKDRERLRALLRGADLCLFSAPLGELEAEGFDPISVQALNPTIVYLHMPGFTAHGPGSAAPESFELLCAATGVSASQYSDEEVPVDPVIAHVLYGQAMWGAAAAIAALIERCRSGFGQTVTVGGLQGMLVTMSGMVTHLPAVPPVHMPGGGGGPMPFYRLYQCQDGEWMFMAGLTPAFHTAAFAALGVLDEIFSDPRLKGEPLAMALPENIDWVIEIVAREFRKRPRSEWLQIIREAGCPCGPVQARENWVDHEQVKAINMYSAVQDPERGLVEMPGIPLNLTRTPASIRTPAPTLGQHNAGVPALSPNPLPVGEAPESQGPLAGFNVLDLGSIIAGTYPCSLLADLGANVIKVESPGGDSLRAFGPTFVGYNLGKRSISLDLRSENGRQAFYRLVQQADFVIDNYRPGVLQRLKVDYDSLVKVNPRIICVSVTGYGEGGPMGMEPGFDPLLQAASGMMRAQGGDDGPVFFALPVNDVGTAATAALGAMLALYHRERTGEGQRVWTSLAGQSLMMQSEDVVRYARRPPAQTGGHDFPGPTALNRLYRVNNGWIRLQATEPRHVDALGKAGFLPNAVAPEDQGATFAALARSFAAVDRDTAIERLRLAGVPAAPARGLRELVSHPQFVSEQATQLLVLPDGQPLRTAWRYTHLSRVPAPPHKILSGFAEHTMEVLTEFGFSEEEIGQLLATGATNVGGPFMLPPPA